MLPGDALNVYSDVNPETGSLYFWPYLPGYFAWIVVADVLAELSSLPYRDLIQLPPIVADAGIAWIVQWFLGRRGTTDRTRLAAAALVMLGPSFAVISGYHTQIDSVAALPAVAAVAVWCERRSDPRRFLWAGLLVGLAATMKTPLGFVLLALVPSARSLREGALLAAVAAGLPLLVVAPFAMADPVGVRHVFEYQGIPGMGGLTLLLQPSLAETWVTEIWQRRPDPVPQNGVIDLLSTQASLVNGALFLAAGGFLLRYRAGPPVAAVVIWVAWLVLGTGFFFQYLIWLLPFLLLAGYLWQAALLQAAFLVPTLIFYLGPRDEPTTTVYAAIMIANWIGLLVALIAVGRRVVVDGGRAGPRSPAPARAA